MASNFPDANDSFATTKAAGDVVPSAGWDDFADAINKMQGYLIQGANLQTGTTYTLILSDNGKVVSMNNAGTNTLTIPPNASVAIPIGASVTIRQAGAGQTNVAPGSGVTLNSRGGLTHLAGQYAYATLIKISTNVWDLMGDLA